MENTSEVNKNPERSTKTASRSETGHAVNVANFGTLVSFCTAYGAQYNPSNSGLQFKRYKN